MRNQTLGEQIILTKHEHTTLSCLLAQPTRSLRTAELVSFYVGLVLAGFTLVEWMFTFDVGSSFCFLLFLFGYACCSTIHRQARLLKYQQQIIDKAVAVDR